ncbi:hypothetical protein J2S43_004649 [Catenuloplanes nepalensis]|uniref:Uncharacterized protein n=1 Tax=Catenuloplanes nepalensis TaxID=587533 RepID=A0ABT9MXH6_9ACTN|nr:hypothetical protein [Catenuloplanes nepalensis]MDP9796137.1 hypothetical protein [Catenuloplanes nepalensis]
MRARLALAIAVLIGTVCAFAVAPAQAVPAATGKYYVVAAPVNGQREYLYAIAMKTLGDGNRYREIVELNLGRTQPDGGALDSGGELKPGWILVLPKDAAGEGVKDGPLPAIAPVAASSRAASPPPQAAAPESTAATSAAILWFVGFVLMLMLVAAMINIMHSGARAAAAATARRPRLAPGADPPLPPGPTGPPGATAPPRASEAPDAPVPDSGLDLVASAAEGRPPAAADQREVWGPPGADADAPTRASANPRSGARGTGFVPEGAPRPADDQDPTQRVRLPLPPRDDSTSDGEDELPTVEQPRPNPEQPPARPAPAQGSGLSWPAAAAPATPPQPANPAPAAPAAPTPPSRPGPAPAPAWSATSSAPAPARPSEPAPAWSGAPAPTPAPPSRPTAPAPAAPAASAPAASAPPSRPADSVDAMSPWSAASGSGVSGSRAVDSVDAASPWSAASGAGASGSRPAESASAWSAASGSRAEEPASSRPASSGADAPAVPGAPARPAAPAAERPALSSLRASAARADAETPPAAAPEPATEPWRTPAFAAASTAAPVTGPGGRSMVDVQLPGEPVAAPVRTAPRVEEQITAVSTRAETPAAPARPSSGGRRPTGPKPPLPGPGDPGPVLRETVLADEGPAGVHLTGVSTGRDTPAYAWLAEDDTPLKGVMPLVIGRRNDWWLHADLTRTPDCLALVGAADAVRRQAAVFARRLHTAGVGVFAVGRVLGEESVPGLVILDQLPELPAPGAPLPAPRVVFCAGADAPATARSLASATAGRIVPILLGSGQSAQWTIRVH